MVGVLGLRRGPASRQVNKLEGKEFETVGSGVLFLHLEMVTHGRQDVVPQGQQGLGGNG